MAPLTPDQLRTRQRVEGLIKLMAPALDLVLAVGERVSRVVEREDVGVLPAARDARIASASEAHVTRDDQLQWEARWAVPAAVAAFVAAAAARRSARCSFFPKDRKGIGSSSRPPALDRRPVRARTSRPSILTALASLLPDRRLLLPVPGGGRTAARACRTGSST